MNVARTVMAPAGTLRSVQRPSAVLDVTRDVPWIVTRAPASGCPVAWSVTWPAMLPCWARADAATPPTRAPSPNNARHVRRCMVPICTPPFVQDSDDEIIPSRVSKRGLGVGVPILKDELGQAQR